MHCVPLAEQLRGIPPRVADTAASVDQSWLCGTLTCHSGIIGALVRGERWRTHATLDNFRAQIERTAPARRSTLLGLATLGEINEMAARARIFTESGILHLIVVPDMKRSLIGAGR